MSIELILYFIDFLKGVGNFLGGLTLIYLLGSIVCAMIAGGYEEDREQFSAYGKRLFKWFLRIGILWLFIPSPSTMYMMVGTRYLKDSNLPAKVEKLFNKKIDELLQDK
jgi:uncharacterized membrane protein